MNAWINFQEIRAKISLEDVIVRFYQITTLKREGNKLIGPCPVHGGDSARAFHADLDKNVWHCFSQCKKGGNQLDFVAAKEGISIREAALKLQAFFLTKTGEGALHPPTTKAGGRSSAPSPASAEGKPPQAPAKTVKEEEEINPPLDVKLDLKSDHPHLIETRRLARKTIEHFAVGYCLRGIMKGTIAIPIHDEIGALVAYAGRRLKPSDIDEFGKYKFPKGFKKERVLYHYHEAKAEMGEKGLILVEGFFAVMKLYEAGLTNAVASMGVELSATQAKLLGAAKEVVLLFDGNEAGWSGALKAKEQLAPLTKVRLVKLPAGMEPDMLPPKALRWLIAGLQALDLAELSFSVYPPRAAGNAAETTATSTTKPA